MGGRGDPASRALLPPAPRAPGPSLALAVSVDTDVTCPLTTLGVCAASSQRHAALLWRGVW